MTPFLPRRLALASLLAAGASLLPVLSNGLLAQDAPATPIATPSASDTRLANDLVDKDTKERHIAPVDTFYMLKAVDARTDKGVDGLLPGQEVKLVQVNREAQTLVVTNGNAQVEVSPADLTNDQDVAAAARQKDEANQAQVAAYQRAQREAYTKYQQAAADYTKKDIEKRQDDQRKQIAEIREAKEAELAAKRGAYQPATAGVGNNAGYYNYGNEGYGSPFAYFAGQALAGANAPANTGSAAPAPAKPANNGAVPAAPAAPATGGRPK